MIKCLASLLFQGANASALEKEIGPEQFPVNEHYFGLVNVSVASLVDLKLKTSSPVGPVSFSLYLIWSFSLFFFFL